MSESATPEAAPLSVQQAIAMLDPPAEVEQAQEAPVEAAEGEQAEGAASAPEEAEGEAEQPAEAEETEVEAEAVAPADPPKYWSQDAKEAFGQLPPDLQAVVLAQEGPREEATAKAKAEAAAKSSAADAEMAKVTQLAEGLAEVLPRALQKFIHDWGVEPDWVAYGNEHGGDALAVRKAEYDADLKDLQSLHTAQAAAADQAHQTYVKAELARLAEIAPDLADPEKGGERRQVVVAYLKKHGSTDAEIRNISAAEMVIANKARLYDEAQAALMARPTPKPTPAARSTAPVRPAAAQSQTPTERSRQAVQAAFNLKPSKDNAIALLLTPKG